jgi:hypothetical protein
MKFYLEFISAHVNNHSALTGFFYSHPTEPIIHITGIVIHFLRNPLFTFNGIRNTALFHDWRRTALTNMIEAGFSEKEAMEISGHKTRNVFDRYHIVSEQRIKQLGNQMEVHLRNKDEELMGTGSEHRQDVKNLNKSFIFMVSRAGLEPATTALKVRCSTN